MRSQENWVYTKKEYMNIKKTTKLMKITKWFLVSGLARKKHGSQYLP